MFSVTSHLKANNVKQAWRHPFFLFPKRMKFAAQGGCGLWGNAPHPYSWGSHEGGGGNINNDNDSSSYGVDTGGMGSNGLNHSEHGNPGHHSQIGHSSTSINNMHDHATIAAAAAAAAGWLKTERNIDDDDESDSAGAVNSQHQYQF